MKAINKADIVILMTPWSEFKLINIRKLATLMRGKIIIDPFDLICGKQIQGSWGGESNPEEDIPKFAKLYRDGELPLEKLLTHRYSLDQINEALNDLEQRKVCRPLIEFRDHHA